MVALKNKIDRALKDFDPASTFDVKILSPEYEGRPSKFDQDFDKVNSTREEAVDLIVGSVLIFCDFWSEKTPKARLLDLRNLSSREKFLDLRVYYAHELVSVVLGEASS